MANIVEELRAFIKEAEMRENNTRGSLYAVKEVSRRLREIIDDQVVVNLGLDPDDSWSVIPKERQAALIEDLRQYARRRMEAEVIASGSSPAPPPDLPTVSETIEQHKGPWYDGIIPHGGDPNGFSIDQLMMD